MISEIMGAVRGADAVVEGMVVCSGQRFWLLYPAIDSGITTEAKVVRCREPHGSIASGSATSSPLSGI